MQNLVARQLRELVEEEIQRQEREATAAQERFARFLEQYGAFTRRMEASAEGRQLWQEVPRVLGRYRLEQFEPIFLRIPRESEPELFELGRDLIRQALSLRNEEHEWFRRFQEDGRFPNAEEITSLADRAAEQRRAMNLFLDLVRELGILEVDEYIDHQNR